MKLVIFDLDQTLVDFIILHDEATRRLFQKLFGVEARLTEIDFAGRSLLDNFRELVRVKKVPPERVKQGDRELLEEYERIFGESLPREASRFILPGVLPLLEELNRRGHLVVLYTGDSRGIAHRVLEATGLGNYFRFSVHAEEAPSRAGMVRLAIERAEELEGRPFRGKDLVVIGDSVRDIEAGKEVGSLTIAVATGFHPWDKLREKRPDYLFTSLEDCRGLLAAIESPKLVEVRHE